MSHFGSRYPCDVEPNGVPTRVTVFTIGARAGKGLPWSERRSEPGHRASVSGGGWSMEAKTRIGRYRIDYFDMRKQGDQILLSFPLGGSVKCASEGDAKERAADHLRGVIEDLTSHL